jgi:hypothetical protein
LEKKEQGLKSKRGETSYEEAPCFKKKRMKFASCWERFYQKKERKEIIFSYSVASSIPTHHLHLHCLLFLSFSLSYSLSLHHLHQP